MNELASQLSIFWQFLIIEALALGLALVVLLISKALPRWLPLSVSTERKVSKSLPDFLFYSLVGIGILVFSGMAIMQHNALHSHAFDLGLFDQLMWNNSQGRFFENSIHEYTPNYLGNHFSPLLILLIPFYWIFPDARNLLAIQSIGLAVAALPLFWLAKEKLSNSYAAAALGVSYLLFPPLHYLNIFGFQSKAIAVPFLAFAFYFLFRRRYYLFLAFILLSLCCKEEIAFVIVACGVYIFFAHKLRLLGAAVTALGAVWGYLAIGVIIPQFEITGDYLYLARYSVLGENPYQMAQTFLLQPSFMAKTFLTADRAEFILRLLVPTGMLSLLPPWFILVSLPTFAYLLLSDYQLHYVITYHYQAPLIPIIFVALVLGLGKLMGSSRPRPRLVLYGLIPFVFFSSLLSYYFHGPGPLSKGFKPERYTVTARTPIAYKLLSLIPPEASVSAQSDFVPQLSHRRKIHVFPTVRSADYIILDAKGYRWPFPDWADFNDVIDDLRVNPYYEVVEEEQGYILFRCRKDVTIETRVDANFEGEMILLGYELKQKEVEAGKNLAVGLFWQSFQKGHTTPQFRTRYTTFAHLVDWKGRLYAQEDREPGYGVRGTEMWLPEDIVYMPYRLPIPVGTPPGEYSLKVGTYATETKQNLSLLAKDLSPAGTMLTLNTINVIKPSIPPSDKSIEMNRLNIALSPDIELLGYGLIAPKVRPGDSLSVPLFWRATSKPAQDYSVALKLVASDGKVYGKDYSLPVDGRYSTLEWSPGEIVKDVHDLLVARDAPMGDYRLLVALDHLHEVEVSCIEVEGRSNVFTAPPMKNTLSRKLGDNILLLGYDIYVAGQRETEPRLISSGQTLHLSLYWKALSLVDKSYTVFTHLVDQGGNIWGQKDALPQNGIAPTTSWLKGEVIVDKYDIMVRADCPPGEYELKVGMYDAETGERLPFEGDADHVILTSLKVAR